MPLAKVWAKPRRGQNPKWPPAAILEIPKSAILRRFYSKITTKVSILTNFMVRNPFQGLFCQISAIFTLKSKMAAILHIMICQNQGYLLVRRILSIFIYKKCVNWILINTKQYHLGYFQFF